jgi:hypothetical protein
MGIDAGLKPGTSGQAQRLAELAGGLPYRRFGALWCGWKSIARCQFQPMQSPAGIAGHQELVGGDPGQSGDGGIGHEEPAVGAIGASGIPEADGEPLRQSRRSNPTRTSAMPRCQRTSF